MQGHRIDRERLDVVLERLSERTPEPLQRPRAERFGRLPRAGDPHEGGGSDIENRSLREDLADFVMPRILEPTIFQRSVPILERLVAEVIPQLDGDELRSLASSLIEDEIGRHRQLLDRLHGGLET